MHSKVTIFAAILSMASAMWPLGVLCQTQERSARKPIPLSCSAADQARCAAQPNPETCFQWTCVPTWEGNLVEDKCVAVQQPAGAACSGNAICIKSGSCDQYGGCVASPGEKTTCEQTPTGMHDKILCWCTDNQCMARLASGQPYQGNVSTMCKAVAGP
jgi:hypothetical protein